MNSNACWGWPMSEVALATLMRTSVDAALEAMFFTGVEQEMDTPEVPGSDRITVGVTFSGNLGGRFVLVLTREAASMLAASFLGVDGEPELETSQIADVVRELANILCGSVLSRLGRQTDFHLAPPELGCPDPFADNSPGLRRWLRIPEGELGLSLWFEGGSEPKAGL